MHNIYWRRFVFLVPSLFFLFFFINLVSGVGGGVLSFGDLEDKETPKVVIGQQVVVNFINSSDCWDNLCDPSDIFLNDLGDTDVPAPNDDEVLYWNDTNQRWQSKLLNLITNFLALTDTPFSYSGNSGNVVRVNSTETGLEFYNVSQEIDDKIDVNTLWTNNSNSLEVRRWIFPKPLNTPIPNVLIPTGYKLYIGNVSALSRAVDLYHDGTNLIFNSFGAQGNNISIDGMNLLIGGTGLLNEELYGQKELLQFSHEPGGVIIFGQSIYLKFGETQTTNEKAYLTRTSGSIKALTGKYDVVASTGGPNIGRVEIVKNGVFLISGEIPNGVAQNRFFNFTFVRGDHIFEKHDNLTIRIRNGQANPLASFEIDDILAGVEIYYDD